MSIQQRGFRLTVSDWARALPTETGLHVLERFAREYGSRCDKLGVNTALYIVSQ